MKQSYLLAIVVGITSGILVVNPLNLRFVPGILLWGVAGVLVGLSVTEREKLIRVGVLYGVSLSVAFLLYSPFLSTLVRSPLIYGLLFIASTLLGVLGGVFAVFVGSKIRNRFI